MVHGFACSFRYANLFHHILNLLGWGGGKGTNRERDHEIDQHTQETDAFGRYAKPIVFAFGQELKIDNITESEKTNPINPYADSKLKLERYLTKEVVKENAFCVILRYFNVAGADLKRRTGYTSDSDNLIKLICEVAAKKRSKLIINGNDYQTKDGTTIRDYIHVLDVADIHITVARSLMKLGENEIYNCGYGKGFSIMEVVDAMNSIIQFDLPIEFGSRRKSDIIHSVANNKKFLKRFNWKPKYNDLKIILKSALEWEKNLNND